MPKRATAAGRVDRRARNIGDPQDIVRAIRTRGASSKATRQPIDTGTAAGGYFLDLSGVFAEFETNLRRERQFEGIAKRRPASTGDENGASICEDDPRIRGACSRHAARESAGGSRSIWPILSHQP